MLIHDAQYTAAEWPAVAHYGHSTVDRAIDLFDALQAGRLILFHHDQSRTDAELDQIVQEIGRAEVTAAAAGDSIEV